MQFEPRLRQGLHDGSITVAFRRWRRVQVVAGHQYRTGAGLVRAESVETITPDDITEELAAAAGFASAAAAVADLRGDAGLPLYCIRFGRLDSPDPRDELAFDRPDFKLHVRRLKALGLTISLDVGYRISPRGAAYLASRAGR